MLVGYKGGACMNPPKKKLRIDPENPKERFFKMRTDERMLEMLAENSRMSGNTKSDEVRIAIEERNKKLKRR